MRNKIYSLVALLVATLTMTACLGDKEEGQGVSYRDTAITSFTLGQLRQVRDTVASDGKDSTYAANYNASNVRFTIDQAQGLIYNPDSLPYGTDVAHVIANITTKNSGLVVIRSLTDEQQGRYYVNTDSIDFSKSRIFRVYANNGSEYRDYKVSVNVHKQKPNELTWNRLQTNTAFSALTALKAVSTRDRIFVFGTNGQQTIGFYTSRQDGNQWTPINRSFSSDSYKGIIVHNDTLMLIDNGQILSSINGTEWNSIATNDTLKQFVAEAPTELFALSVNNRLVSLRTDGTNIRLEVLDTPSSLLPVDNINYVQTEAFSGAGVTQVLLAGTIADGSRNTVWTKLAYGNRQGTENQWNHVESSANKFRLPLYNHLSIFSYDQAAIALGIENGRLANILESRDGGITWKESKLFAYPEGASATATLAATVDREGYIWLISGANIWRGRLNRIGWALNSSQS